MDFLNLKSEPIIFFSRSWSRLKSIRIRNTGHDGISFTVLDISFLLRDFDELLICSVFLGVVYSSKLILKI